MNHLSDERLADFSHKEQLLPREELEFIYEKLDYCDPSRVSEMTLLILTSLNLTKPPSSHHAVTEAVDYVRTLIYIVTDRDIEASRRQCAITTLDTLYKYFSEAATAMKENELQQHVAALDNPKLEPEVRIQTENQCAALDIIWHSWAVVFLVLGARLGNLYEKYWDVADKENKVVTALKQLKLGGKATDLTRGQMQKEIENYTELREIARDELHDLGCDWWECIHSIRLAQQEYERLMKSYKLAIEAYRNLQWEAQAKDSSMDFDSPVPPTFPLESNHKLRAHTKSWFQAKERGMVEREAMQPQSQSSSSKRSSGSRRLDVPGPTIIITDENGENFHLRNELPFEAQHEVLEWEKKRSDANSRMRIRMTTPEPDEEICFSGIPVASVPLEELLAVNENNDKKWGYLEEEKPVHSPTLPYNYSSVLEEVLSHEISMEDEWLDYLPARPESRHHRYAQGEQSTDDSFPIASEPELLFGPDGEILMEDFHSASLLNTVPENFGKVPLVKKVSPQALGTVAKAVGRKFQQVFPNGQEYDSDPQTSDTEDNDESDCTNSASGTSKSHGEDPGSAGVYGRDRGDLDDGLNDSDDKHEKDGDEDGESTEEYRMEEYTKDDERADDEIHLDLYWPSTTHRIHQYMDTTYAPTNNIIQLFEAMKIGSHNNLQPETLSHCQSKLFQNRCRNIRSNIPLLRRRIPNLPWHVRYPVKKPLRILDRRLGEEDSFGYLTREHYIYRLVEWARDSLCHPSNAAKYAIILRESQGRFSEETDNIEYEGPPIESEIAAVVEWLSKKFPEVWIDALPGSFIGCHQYIRPGVIQLHSGLFYSVEKGVQEGKPVAHVIWLIFQTISYEFAHYLGANAKASRPDSPGGFHCLHDEEGQMGDLIELLLYGAQGSWDCTNPDLETPIEMDCPGGFWWDEDSQKQYTTLSPQKAVDFIKNTPEIRRLNSKQWVALSKRPTPEHSPSEEDLKIPSSRDPEDQETYHVIPQIEEIPDADALYARRKIVDERDRKLIRLRRDWKKSTATDDLNKMCVGKRYKSRKNIPTPMGYPEILCWYHIILFFLAPVYLILAVSLLMLEPPQIDPYDGPSTLVIILGLVMALIYSTFGFLPLRRMMLWFGLLIKE